MDHALSFQNIEASYHDFKVLNDVSFNVKKGSFFSLIGHNGAGKSTLLKCLLDFYQLDKGHISIMNKPHAIPESRRVLSYLPERFIPPAHLKGMELIKYLLTLHGTHVSSDQIRYMMDALELRESALEQSTHTYSKGMAQKLGLAIAFLSAKPLLILDEPMSGLDPKARILVKRQIKQLKNQQTTVFFTSHSLSDVEELADEMAILDGGELLFQGTPDECRSDYNSETLEDAFMQCINA